MENIKLFQKHEEKKKPWKDGGYYQIPLKCLM